jgi:hypothetical protein
LADSKRKKQAASGGSVVDLSKIPMELRGWFLRTLNIETKGEYGKLLRNVEFFLIRAEEQLEGVLWDRVTHVALDEALRYLTLRWGTRFVGPLHLEIRITETNVNFSIAVPPGACPKGAPTPSTARLEAADKCLYVVQRLMHQVQRSPKGRQLVFRRTIRPFRKPMGLS